MRTVVTALFAGLSILICYPLHAQTQQTQTPQSQPTQPQNNLLTSEQLDQLLAPIALYPDNLLSEVLMASTYPLEVVEADRWRTANKALKGDGLKAAVDKQKWDDSIKSLTAVPDVLQMMSSKLDWTQKLGDAVLAQQTDVMDAVQRLRQRAQAQDKLKTTKQQKVSTSQQSGKDYIVIEPVEPNTLYVPYYDPAVVYGAWPYPAYPPYFFPAPPYLGGAVLASGIAFAAGVAVGAWAAHGGWWGGGFHWGNNNININNNIDINNRNNWVHNSDHRHGVRYNNTDVRNRFAKGDAGNRDRHMDFRGRDGNQVLRPDGGGLKPGDDRTGRDGAGQRRDADNRPEGDKRADRPGGDKRADRPAAGNKHADRPSGNRRPDHARPNPRPGGGRDSALSHVDRGRAENRSGMRGHASVGGRGGGGGFHAGGGRGGGAFHAGGGRGGGGFHGGGGRGRR